MKGERFGAIILKAAGLIMLAVFMLLTCLYLLIQSPPFKELLRSRLERAARASGIALSIGSLKGSLIAGVTLSEVSVRAEGRPFITAEEVSLDYFLPALLRKRLALGNVTLVAPRVTLERNARGEWNHVLLAPPSGKKDQGANPLAGWSAAVREIRIEEGSLVVIDHTKEDAVRFAAGSIDLSAAGTTSMTARGVTLSAALERLDLEGSKPPFEVRSSSGDFAYDGESLRVGRFSLETRSSRGEISGSVRLSSAPVLAVRGEFPVIEVEELSALLPGLDRTGTASTSFSLDGPLTSLRFRHLLSYRGASLESRGIFNGSVPSLKITSAFRDLDPALVFGGRAVRRGSVNVDLDAELCGRTLPDLAGRVSVEVLPSTWAGRPVRGALAIRLEDLTVTSTTGYLVSPAGTFVMRGSGTVRGLADPAAENAAELELEGTGVNLAAVAGLPESDLDLSSTLRVAQCRNGPLRAAGTITVTTSTVRGMTVTGAFAEASYRDGVLTLSRLEAATPQASVWAAGALSTGTVCLAFRAASSDLSSLEPVLRIPLSGAVVSSGTVTGEPRHPAVCAAVNGDSLRYGGFEAQGLDGRFQVTASSRPAGGLRMQLNGISAAGRRFDTIAVTAEGTEDQASFALDARSGERVLSSAGTVLRKGAATRVRLGTLTLCRGTTVWALAAPAEAAFSGREVRVAPFTLASGTRMIKARGAVIRNGTVDGRLELIDLDLGTVAGLLDIGTPMAGTVDATVIAGGSAADPRLFASATAYRGVIEGFAFDRIVSTGTYAAGEARFSLAVEKNARKLLAAGGAVPVDITLSPVRARTGSSGLDLRVRSEALDLALFAALVPGVESASGSLTLDLSATGDPSAPELNGELVVSSGTLKIRGTGLAYGGLNGRVRVRGETVWIEDLRLTGGDGFARVNGTLTLRELRPYDADLLITARDFKPVDLPVFSGIIDADLGFTGDPGAPLLDGTVTVLESVINIPKEGRRPVEEVTVVPAPGAGSTGVIREGGQVPSVYDSLAIDAALVVPGDTWIRGAGLDAEARGKLLARKEEGGALTLTGEIRSVRGTYELRGRKLNLREGQLTFTGGPRIDPQVRARAQTQIEDVSISVLLGGTISQPEVSFQSEPPLDQSEILSYLIFGRPTEKLGEQENRVVQRTTASILGGIATEGVRDFLGRGGIAPDVVDVYTGEERGLALGKYLTNRVFLRYEWRFGVESRSQALIEVQLSEHFNLRSVVGSERTTGTDLLWSYDY